MNTVRNRKIPTIYEFGLNVYYSVIILISTILSYPLSAYFLVNRGVPNLVLLFFTALLSIILIFALFMIFGGILLSDWLEEKEKNEGNNFQKYVF